ncbi:hypothetical protein SASPL_123699 [Salvia splendens]|uniref:Myb/SANT-like domain-containing protein n=1 Tax=Salvia splendens TaxID=180675 RepID=A0A8X8XM60_SALSN|nr:uncharacterized protein LOC121743932 [Salvia splendens]XP_041993274.1 uncharacterized protein LOC121743932 [Salvia splendens]XP_041993275.1 uncharacterized protein LOC121743932 [Salvia splendens]KAG6416273.1 hypothetical protein SASPL_123699 [Salvia splendens]
MLELLAQGWKSDNGFRTGYLGKIEDSLRKEFPNTDLKGTPHITSRISAWKKSYTSLTKILGRSGVGFNSDGQYMIECDDDQLEAIVQADKDAKFMRGKSCPLWETWKAIFGKDHASGAGAEQVADAVHRLRGNGPSSSEVNENDFPGFEDQDSDNVVRLSQASGFEGYNSGNNGKQASINNSGRSQKRRHVVADASLMEFLSNLHAETNARLEVISSRIRYEFDLGKAKQDVFDKLETVEGLTLDQRYELCNILSDKPQRLEVFMGMRADARLGYLLKLIEENQKVM